MKVLEQPLDAISRVARPYPSYLLRAGDSALCLFCAAYLGHNDVIHMARAEMDATCVDIDGARLEQMRVLYPVGWEWICEDAWGYAANAVLVDRTWDVVSVDTFTGDATEKSLEMLLLWCALANRAVTATIRNDQPYRVPPGWKASLFERSPHVSWLVLQRD